MSDWLLPAGISASFLAFYPLVIGLTHLKLFRATPRLLKGLHLGGWGLTLLLFIIFLGWHISLRGQWLDALPFGLAWVAAGSYFWRCRRQLGWVGKLYFGSWFAYPAALALAYLVDKILFALVVLPLFAFLPTPTYYSSPTATLRAPIGGLLAAQRVQLLTPVGFGLEKHVGLTADNLLADENDTVTAVKLQPDWRPDSIAALVTTRRTQRVLRFGR